MKDSPKIILVTGSAGHLGEALVRTLRVRGMPVRGIDIKSSAFTDHVGSILDAAFVRDCMKGIGTVLHAATLHKPHVVTHTAQDFIDVNVTGTLRLLEEAVTAGVEGFIFTSTTSTFGSALTPAPGEPAAWVTEGVTPVPKNIYGTTKLMAETLSELFARRHKLPVIVLRTSRFFPEADDDAAMRARFDLDNAQANELLHRRLDIADAVEAHLCAAERAPTMGFARYIVSATSPFGQDDLADLRQDAAGVMRRLYSDCAALYAKKGWHLFPSIDRVYVNDLARRELGWNPSYNFAHVLECLREGRDFRSPLAVAVGSKGYHDRVFEEGPYPVAGGG
ncbi:NAD(P)-dependent oxidoreductase [Methylocella sp. CPCC 101449]|uniref:NAD-dependent epimerase/dehydratase family protein n=1 Tax=Methylocella sp. CPCC 101449 TaxID=2987531 RepID=UPI00288F0522|nr:NAD(P)-dependent oxidoreductase [Methylocella sp. CPCC 101449]MDT2021799.1 NAD(P)-dependent oxidoreductase [Methylocella sp. CPCC 101449]